MDIILIIMAITAGIGKALRDTVAHHFYDSIFNRIKYAELWYWFRSDWKDKPNHPVWFLWDAWHFGDTLLIMAFFIAIYKSGTWPEILAMAIIFGITFNILYKKFFLIHS